jgi:pyruvate carboxylase
MQLAIYSPADRLQPHRYKADESYQVGSPDMTPVQCYLDVENILSLAK